MYTFQEIVAKLSHFWQQQGCVICQPYDVEKGAATFSPHTFFRCLGPEPFHAAYIEPCRRPKDGRYALNPNRLQHYFQYQVILKPSPYNIQDLYLQSLEAIGLKLDEHDIRFVHDDWEQPTIGAWGLGWEVWIDGQECTQFTYFQAVAGVSLKPITGEITYGIERLALYLQNKNSLFDLQWNDHISYADLWKQNEIEWSRYNFEKSDPKMWFSLFETYEKEAKRLVEAKLPIPALDFVMKASHSFNILDARGAISVTERASYIATIRDISRLVAECYLESRKELGYPLLGKVPKQLNALAPIPSVQMEHTEMKQAEDLLIEIGCEELPATFVPIGMDNLKRAIETLLAKEELSFTSISNYGTPRRLAIIVQGLAPYKSARTIEKKGPALASAFDEKGLPTSATIGFLKNIGLPDYKKTDFEDDKINEIWIDTVKDTPYIFALQKTERELTQLILERELPRLILGIDFPKKMRWADLDITFARPLRWIAALYGKEVLSFSVGPINSSCYSFGHRQLSNEMFRLESASQYTEELRNKEVIVDTKERKQEILQQLQAIENTSGFAILEKERVIPQVLYLVEKPYAAIADFDPSFLDAPKEVLISEMCEHQKYFPVSNSKGELVNKFVITANIPSTKSIERGNQKVLSARLSDGAFLYTQDLKTSLEGFSEKLKGILFQKGLGTVYDKIERMKKEILVIGQSLPNSSQEYLKEAASLAKADLATEVVQEFPELQGAMGRVYALKQGKAEEVALAIDEQWMPRGEQSPLPRTVTGVALSLTEKIDNLISFFGLGLKPTSSSDPFALRRQALGIVKIILAHSISIDLRSVMNACVTYFPDNISKKKEALIPEILDFIIQRARSYFQDEGFSKGVIEACLSIREENLLDVYKRIQALHIFKNENSTFAKLCEVHKRSLGQTVGFTKFTLNEKYLTEIPEVDLYKAIRDISSKYTSLVQEQRYSNALLLIATLQPVLSNLFENVKILSDDNNVRENRIALLQKVSALFEQIADFQKIQDR